MASEVANNEKKTLIFFAGPTGSGKSSLVGKTVKYLETQGIVVDLEERKNVIAIDNFIENHTLYKKLIFRIFFKYLRKDNNIKDNTTDNKSNNTYDKRIFLEDYNAYLGITPADPDSTTIADKPYNTYKILGSSDTINIKSDLIDAEKSILLTDYLSAIYFYIRDTKSMSCNRSSSLPPPPPPPPPLSPPPQSHHRAAH